jgi:sulfate-transporting ATPase
LLGLGAGAAYGLAALGLVLVYRGSGVINFAHGAVGMIGTFAFYELHDVRHWSFASAAVPALVVCALLGVAIQLLVMGPLQHSSGLAKLLATLGVLTTLEGLAGLRYHSGSVVVASSLPRSTVQIAGAVIGWDRLLIFALVVVLVAILFALYRYSKFGIATAAVAENPRAAAHLGHSPTAIACANWAMGSMLAGLAGILLAPITGLSVAGLTLLVIPALAAAVVGRMLSFPVTLLAGVLIGVAQSEITRYVSSPGWANAVPFFVIIVMLSLRGTGLPTRGTESQRMPAVGLGRIRLWLLAIALAVVIGLVQVVPPEWVDGITVSITVAIVVLSIVVVTGYAGQVSLAQWMMAGLGAWIAAKLVTSAGFSMLAALLIAVVVMIPIGVVIGLPALRSRGDQLAIVTLGVSVAIEQLIFNSPALTGGSTGLQVGFPTVFGIDVDNIIHPRSYAVVSICLFTICAVAIERTGRRVAGRVGHRRQALRIRFRRDGSRGRWGGLLVPQPRCPVQRLSGIPICHRRRLCRHRRARLRHGPIGGFGPATRRRRNHPRQPVRRGNRTVSPGGERSAANSHGGRQCRRCCRLGNPALEQRRQEDHGEDSPKPAC